MMRMKLSTNNTNDITNHNIINNTNIKYYNQKPNGYTIDVIY